MYGFLAAFGLFFYTLPTFADATFQEGYKEGFQKGFEAGYAQGLQQTANVPGDLWTCTVTYNYSYAGLTAKVSSEGCSKTEALANLISECARKTDLHSGYYDTERCRAEVRNGKATCNVISAHGSK
jgi:hypothetical protein